MRQDNNTRFERVEVKVEENKNALEDFQERIDALENSKSSSSSKNRKGSEQNSVCAVPTAFAETSTDEEVREFFTRSDQEQRNGRKS